MPLEVDSDGRQLNGVSTGGAFGYRPLEGKMLDASRGHHLVQRSETPSQYGQLAFGVARPPNRLAKGVFDTCQPGYADGGRQIGDIGEADG